MRIWLINNQIRLQLWRMSGYKREPIAEAMNLLKGAFVIGKDSAVSR